jgi:putative endonuclease
MMQWVVYMIRCNDETLYTGITSDLDRRIARHNAGTSGAKYVRSRRPVTLVYSHPYSSRSQASQEEFRIKQLSRSQKLRLIPLSQSLGEGARG